MVLVAGTNLGKKWRAKGRKSAGKVCRIVYRESIEYNRIVLENFTGRNMEYFWKSFEKVLYLRMCKLEYVFRFHVNKCSYIRKKFRNVYSIRTHIRSHYAHYIEHTFSLSNISLFCKTFCILLSKHFFSEHVEHLFASTHVCSHSSTRIEHVFGKLNICSLEYT